MTSSAPSHVSPGEPVLASTVNWLIDAAHPYMSAPGEWRMTDNSQVFGPETDDLVPAGSVSTPSKTPRCWDPMLSAVQDSDGNKSQKVFGATNCLVSWGRQLYNFGNLKSASPLSGDVYALFTLKSSGGYVPDVQLSAGSFNTGDGLLSKDSFKMPLWRVSDDGTVKLDCRGMPFMPVYN